MREMVMDAKNWWKSASWIAAILTIIGMVGGSFMYVSSNYAQVREVERVDTQVIVINNTLREVARSMSTVKTMVTMLNTNMTTRLDDVTTRLDRVDHRLDRIDDRLSRLEGKMMVSNTLK